MRVVVLGGAGEMGRVAVRTAVGLDFVTEVVVADRDLAGAQALAERHPAKAKAAAVDLRDGAGLAKVLAGANVVMNAAGPFFELGVPVLEAAIEAGAHYLDICDDWEPTLEMLALSDRAKSRGVTAVIGIGASPGLTNLLAVKAASMLDTTDELLTGWCIDDVAGEESAKMAQRAEPSAATIHWMQQLSGKIQVHKDGQAKLVRPLQRREIAFPGLGKIGAWTVGHPEAVTLPRTVRGMQACGNVMTCSDEKIFLALKLLQGLVDTKVLSLRDAARELEKPDTDRKERAKPAKDLPGLFGWASGLKQGRPTISAAWLNNLPAGGMGGTTGVPLGLALNLFADQARRPPAGVLTPEEAIDPDWFFDLLAPHCAGGFVDGASLVKRGEIVAETSK